MKKWNQKQKQLVAEILSNLAVGVFLIAVITPLISGIKNVTLFMMVGFAYAVFSLSLFVISFRLLKK